jgi:hypothetical protein
VTAAAWTRPADVVAWLWRRWDDGTLLREHLSEAPWAPIVRPIRGPTARDLTARFDEVDRWTRAWAPTSGRPWRVQTRAVGGRHAGVNQLPDRVCVDHPATLWTVLGVRPDVELAHSRLAAAQKQTPRLAPWIRAHPMTVLRLGDTWPLLMSTVRWIDEHGRPGLYLRQVDVPGVDTKFIEAHRGVLAELLDWQLDPDRIDNSCPRSNLAGRFRFARKPGYARFRPDPADPRFGGLAEVTLRLGDLAAVRPAGRRVIIVENDVSYLALPRPADTLIIFGSGYALSGLAPAGWLAERQVDYWGDLDTHGFRILDRLRRLVPDARSLLMDRSTLLAHPTQWVREPEPVVDLLPQLNPDEGTLYRDLVEDTYGPSIRLEQERIRFSLVRQAILGDPPPPRR